MRVLMQTRTDAERFGGGDVTQVMETAKVLTGLGVEVVFDSKLTAQYRDFDIVHLFNTTRINETWQQWRAAVRVGVPVVVSPIWHSVAEMRRYFEWYYRFRPFPIWTYSGLREVYYARRAGFPLAAKCVWGYRRCIREVMEGADALLPEFRDGKHGWVVTPGDVRSLEVALRGAGNLDRAGLSARGHVATELVKARYDAASVATRFYELTAQWMDHR